MSIDNVVLMKPDQPIVATPHLRLARTTEFQKGFMGGVCAFSVLLAQHSIFKPEHLRVIMEQREILLSEMASNA